MRLILTALLAFLLIPHQSKALPFTPDNAEVEVLAFGFGIVRRAQRVLGVRRCRPGLDPFQWTVAVCWWSS